MSKTPNASARVDTGTYRNCKHFSSTSNYPEETADIYVFGRRSHTLKLRATAMAQLRTDAAAPSGTEDGNEQQ